jgi:hypothetical protein
MYHSLKRKKKEKKRKKLMKREVKTTISYFYVTSKQFVFVNEIGQEITLV